MAALGFAVLFLAVLYHWLTGHWFARVIVFMLGLVAFSVGCLALGWVNSDPFEAAFISGVGAWAMSGIPLYVHNARARRLAKETERFLGSNLTIQGPFL